MVKVPLQFLSLRFLDFLLGTIFTGSVIAWVVCVSVQSQAYYHRHYLGIFIVQ